MAKHHLFTQIWQAPAVRNVRRLASAKRWYRWFTADRRRLPDYLVAGAQKSGTTSLWAYLSEHPNVEPPMTKEMSFFDRHYHRGMGWYRMHFPLESENAARPSNKKTQTGESTAYYMFHPLAPQRIAQALPDVKIILMLRNPVDRAFSHYQLKVVRNREPLSFEEAIAAEPERLSGEHEKILANGRYYSAAHDRHSYLARGIYAEQILRWQQWIPPERLLILESGEFFRNTEQIFAQVLQFLGLPQWKPSQFGNRFPGRYQERMHEATRAQLIEYFRPHNERLYQLLGRQFDWEAKKKSEKRAA
jgi:hypothetical protein